MVLVGVGGAGPATGYEKHEHAQMDQGEIQAASSAPMFANVYRDWDAGEC